jgi:hypothetical protein
MSYSWYADNAGSKFNTISKDLKGGKIKGVKHFKSDDDGKAAIGPRTGSKYVGIQDSSGNHVFMYCYPDKLLEIVGFSGSDPTDAVMVISKKYGIEFTDDYGVTTSDFGESGNGYNLPTTISDMSSSSLKILDSQSSVANKFIRSQRTSIRRRKAK